MPTAKVEHTYLSIVLRGNFNPSIFNPDWFYRNNLIPKTEYENAEIEIITPQITRFKLEWLNMEVVDDRFFVLCEDESLFGPLKDLVISTFQLLEHTPLRQYGINCHYHLSVGGEENWRKVGQIFVPSEIWGHYLNSPLGVKSLEFSGSRFDDFDGSVNIKAEPSTKVDFGIYVEVNNHIEFDSIEDNLVSIFNKVWENSIKTSKEIALGAVNEALNI